METKERVRGERRADGKVFWCSVTRQGKHGKYEYELWISEAKFDEMKGKVRERERRRLKERYGETRTAKGVARTLRDRASRRAKRDNAKVTVSQTWIYDRLCPLIESKQVVLARKQKGAAHPLAPSLDKIDPSIRDYSETNTRVVPWCINAAKNSFTDDQVKNIVIPSLLQFYFPDKFTALQGVLAGVVPNPKDSDCDTVAIGGSESESLPSCESNIETPPEPLPPKRRRIVQTTLDTMFNLREKRQVQTTLDMFKLSSPNEMQIE